MLKVPATDNKVYLVPSWSDFRTWIRRVMVAYVFLAVGTSIGIYAYSNQSKHDIINQINTYSINSCLASLKPGSVLDKYNDFLQGAIDARNDSLAADVRNGDTAAAKRDQKAIKRYSNDFAQIPTKEQCQIPILKK